MIHLLDVSEAQGRIRWNLVPRDYAGIVAKLTEGAFYRDPSFARNVADAHSSGFACGLYHFCRPSQDAAAQARAMWDAAGPVMPDMRPALDLENAPDSMSPAALVDWFLRLADEVESRFGLPPIVYTYPWFERARIAPGVTSAASDRLARCPLWMADYSKGESPPAGAAPYTPGPWRTWTMWQTSGNNSSRVPGIFGAVDHDLFNGDADAFRRFRGIPDPAPTSPDPIVHAGLDMPLPDLSALYDDEDDG